MVRLASPQHIFAAQLKSVMTSKVPFSILFAHQVSHQGNIDVDHIDNTYKKLNLSYLWSWTETISPGPSWQTASWLLLQHDLIQVIAHLCQKTWSDEKLAAYNALHDQIKKNISSTTDSSQHLLLMGYIVKQLQSL